MSILLIDSQQDLIFSEVEAWYLPTSVRRRVDLLADLAANPSTDDQRTDSFVTKTDELTDRLVKHRLRDQGSRERIRRGWRVTSPIPRFVDELVRIVTSREQLGGAVFPKCVRMPVNYHESFDYVHTEFMCKLEYAEWELRHLIALILIGQRSLELAQARLTSTPP